MGSHGAHAHTRAHTHPAEVPNQCTNLRGPFNLCGRLRELIMKPISARHKYALSPPAPGPAFPAHPALRAPPTAAVGRHSGAARRSCNFAPKRPHLAAWRAGDKSCGAAAGGRAAKVCSLIVRKCVCVRPGARRGGGGDGGRGDPPLLPPPLASAGYPNRD
nr:uncharacterized protein LOC130541294 isoform X1 [Pan paniscus]